MQPGFRTMGVALPSPAGWSGLVLDILDIVNKGEVDLRAANHGQQQPLVGPAVPKGTQGRWWGCIIPGS